MPYRTWGHQAELGSRQVLPIVPGQLSGGADPDVVTLFPVLAGRKSAAATAVAESALAGAAAAAAAAATATAALPPALPPGHCSRHTRADQNESLVQSTLYRQYNAREVLLAYAPAVPQFPVLADVTAEVQQYIPLLGRDTQQWRPDKVLGGLEAGDDQVLSVAARGQLA